MGFALWIACAAAAFFLARLVRAGRTSRWLGELLTALVVATLLGGLATALDFGGWGEPDWRSGAFTLTGSFASVALLRLMHPRSG